MIFCSPANGATIFMVCRCFTAASSLLVYLTSISPNEETWSHAPHLTATLGLSRYDDAPPATLLHEATPFRASIAEVSHLLP